MEYFLLKISDQLNLQDLLHALWNLSHHFNRKLNQVLRSEVAAKTSCWPCCCVSPLSMHPPLRDPPTRWFQTCDWRRRDGFVVIDPVPIHQWTWALYSASHLRRGQFLHLQTPLGKKLKEFAFLLHLCHIFASSHTSLCGHLGFGLIPRLRSEKEVSALDLNFWEEACGLCSITWSVGFLCCTKKHGSTNLQNRWKRGSCGGKAGRRCSRCSQDKRTGKLDLNYSSFYCSSGILSHFSNVLRQWRAPCSL